MRIARFILKVVAVSLGVVAAACCVVAYWDKIADSLCCMKDKIAEKGACYCHPTEYDDYADWDD